ncbi:hypothetical protein SARC_09383 [Sphaeroforma arctica JP610]|uniref:Fe2OG dioxygenase domain-containing protein n=1 Tax=Sphaeroforma arctica JP610 TaxID=667725 RepID=A0A0L0FNY7_9EUKA|nr:hypothetical protein SARC_09383 [Sphaeroforma arctica JP610]KNC78176.1 hypothetical protein SARC_09383 [Sphaeroforma arctica JP610]|eukprot:XP_014152078.1 hypothetical protein SARC_09383 [Sphaeroforma arctica JP610]
MSSEATPISETNISERIYQLSNLAATDAPLRFGEGDAKRVSDIGSGLDGDFDYDYEGQEEDEEEEIVEMSEAELIAMLDGERDPLSVCQQLFVKSYEDKLDAAADLKYLSKSQIQELYNEGYFTMDWDASLVAATRVEIMDLINTQQIKLEPAGHQPGTVDSTSDDENVESSGAFCASFDSRARGDSISFLKVDESPVHDTENLSQMIALYKNIQRDLKNVINLKHESAEYQLALYPGRGTHYEKHRDALPDDGSEWDQRRVTIICYLNSEWKEADGGHLRIYKPPMTGGDQVEIEPQAGRVIVFLSGAIDHEVMPSYAERLALTAWCQ